MNRFYVLSIIIGLYSLVLSACGATNADPQVIVITQEVTVIVVVTATPEPVPNAVGEVGTTPAVAAEGDWILPEEALDHIGEVVSVRMDRANCAYRESSTGKPTFCNDKPFPGHDFTFVVWGRDWSTYDGACVIVEGEIEVYDGKAQIEVQDEAQVGVCP